MTKKDLPDLRRLVKNGSFDLTGHAYDQMLIRDISFDDVERILSSETNQLIEVQPPTDEPGRSHKNERILIYDPLFTPDTILVCVVNVQPIPEVIVITAERALPSKWRKVAGADPGLVRIR